MGNNPVGKKTNTPKVWVVEVCMVMGTAGIPR